MLGLSQLYAYNLTQNRRTLNNTVTAFGPVVDIPLFDWGRRAAAAQAQREALDGALLAYRQTVLEAVAEAESALAALAQAGERAQALNVTRTLLAQARERQRTRQRLGLASAGDTLDAERADLQAELELGAAELVRAQSFVVLYKSLGGAPLARDAMTAAAPGAGPTP